MRLTRALAATYKVLVGDPAARANGQPVDDDAAAAAIRRYEERLARDPTSVAFAPLAELHRRAGRPAEAIRLCREGLRHAPEHDAARLVLSRALLDTGDVEAGLAEATAVLATRPRDAAAHRMAAEATCRLGRFDEAGAHFRHAVALDSADRESRAWLDVLEGAGSPADGSPLRRLLADDTFATLSFGSACLEQGLVDEAAQIFVRILRKDPGQARARERLDEALRIKTQRRKGS